MRHATPVSSTHIRMAPKAPQPAFPFMVSTYRNVFKSLTGDNVDCKWWEKYREKTYILTEMGLMADMIVHLGKAKAVSFGLGWVEINWAGTKGSALPPENSLTCLIVSFWSVLPTLLNLLCCYKVCILYLNFRVWVSSRMFVQWQWWVSWGNGVA